MFWRIQIFKILCEDLLSRWPVFLVLFSIMNFRLQYVICNILRQVHRVLLNNRFYDQNRLFFQSYSTCIFHLIWFSFSLPISRVIFSSCFGFYLFKDRNFPFFLFLSSVLYDKRSFFLCIDPTTLLIYQFTYPSKYRCF